MVYCVEVTQNHNSEMCNKGVTESLGSLTATSNVTKGVSSLLAWPPSFRTRKTATKSSHWFRLTVFYERYWLCWSCAFTYLLSDSSDVQKSLCFCDQSSQYNYLQWISQNCLFFFFLRETASVAPMTCFVVARLAPAQSRHKGAPQSILLPLLIINMFSGSSYIGGDVAHFF